MPNGFEITGERMWEKLERIERSLGNVDKAVTQLSGKLDRNDDRLTNHEGKIRSLELKVYGIAAGLLAAVTILVSGLLN